MNALEISLDQLLQGLSTKIKEKEFYPTKSYVEPFIDRVSKITDTFDIQVILPDQITIEDTENITYNRVWIQAELPEEYDGHIDVIGMLYGLDTRKPVVKFYRGGLNMACTNLQIFQPRFLQEAELKPKEAIDYSPVDYLVKEASTVEKEIKYLKGLPFARTEENINESLGKWIRACLSQSFSRGVGVVKLATSTAIDAYKLLFENVESPYYVPDDENTTMFNVYNAFSQLITNDKKDIINKPDKTILLKNILGLLS